VVSVLGEFRGFPPHKSVPVPILIVMFKLGGKWQIKLNESKLVD
jgi:hypothetical protein